ncbi:pentatricopeptide repeat-containing protein At4g02750-like [Selaginella moellendorffii]|uniref:pentatricopeptide repeat-containing protein At4g02750-like n=1 Tax=Selaginella moellendorffii TaxID=88036 RepID=UPI000D1C3438|nr:pentatricopeptide repeat-containing protein At4g02750-like [Selaginella moellendorffii]|eukprot:XP_024532367.1 pentatricopeptide repeat-containing protein At4g02750-like [Selaginella moellendorffii]
MRNLARVDHYASLARECKDLEQAWGIHSSVVAAGGAIPRDRYLSNLLIEMFGRCGSIEDAQRVFSRIDQPNIFSWNLMLGAYAQAGDVKNAQLFFDRMPQRDVVSWNSLLAAYAREGLLDQCWQIFERAPQRNAVSWASIVSMLVKNRRFPEAVDWFLRMDVEGFRPSGRCFVSLLEACTALGDPKLGGLIHEEAIASGFAARNVVVASALIRMYGEFGNLYHAEAVFWRMEDVNLVAMTSMVVAYAQSGHIDEAKNLFSKIKKPDVVAWTCMITAYGDEGDLHRAKQIFDKMLVKNVVSWNALVTAYAQNGYLVQARQLFDQMTFRDSTTWFLMLTTYTKILLLLEAFEIFSQMPKENLIAWNSLLSAYAQAGHAESAIGLFKLMVLEGISCNEVTFVIVLDACASIPDLKLGKALDEVVLGCGFESNATIGTSLIDMYKRCGSLAGARKAFARVSKPDVICWTSLMLAYAQAGHTKEPLELFWAMCNDGVGPNEVTLAGVLYACCHSGKLEESKAYFSSIEQDFGLIHTVDHFVCLVDMLGRSGRLDDAEEMVRAVGLESEMVAWVALLAACKLHGDGERARRIAESVFRMETKEESPYLLLANVCSDQGRRMGLQKLPVSS